MCINVKDGSPSELEASTAPSYLTGVSCLKGLGHWIATIVRFVHESALQYDLAFSLRSRFLRCRFIT